MYWLSLLYGGLPISSSDFEYEKAIEPRIMKCDFCIERTKKGMIPACVRYAQWKL
jgi:Fe-S-cluster-containing dehydrogenase component